MKFSRLFRLGKQGYDIYRSYRGHSRYGSSYGGSSRGYGGSYRRGGTLERLLRRLLK